MPNFGTLFAIEQKTVDKLITLQDKQLLHFVKNFLEDNYYEQNPEQTLELGASWDAIHRSITGGLLHYQSGTYPLNTVILGGTILYGQTLEQDDYLILLKNRAQVQDASGALKNFTDEQFKNGYSNIDIEDYNCELGLSDMQKSLENFHLLKKFWQKAAEQKQNIIFTLDI